MSKNSPKKSFQPSKENSPLAGASRRNVTQMNKGKPVKRLRQLNLKASAKTGSRNPK